MADTPGATTVDESSAVGYEDTCPPDLRPTSRNAKKRAAKRRRQGNERNTQIVSNRNQSSPPNTRLRDIPEIIPQSTPSFGAIPRAQNQTREDRGGGGGGGGPQAFPTTAAQQPQEPPFEIPEHLQFLFQDLQSEPTSNNQPRQQYMPADNNNQSSYSPLSYGGSSVRGITRAFNNPQSGSRNRSQGFYDNSALSGRYTPKDEQIVLQDEWKPAPSVPIVNSEIPLRSLYLRRLAEDASILLELYSRSELGGSEELKNEHRNIIDNAFESISKIQKEYRKMDDQKKASAALEADDMKTDSGCIICYSQIADTVLIPCNHLVLCTLCCDKMGIKEKATRGRRTIRCPICRTNVLDRMKIFRG